MKKITKFFVFFLLFISLAGNLFNINVWNQLKKSSEAWDKRNLHHWLSIQSRVEELEEAAQVAATAENTVNRENDAEDGTLADPSDTTVGGTDEEATEAVTEATAE